MRSQGQGVKPAAEKFVASALSYLPRPHPVPPTGQPSSSCPAPPPFSIWKKEACCLCILTVAKRLNCLRAGSLGWLDEPGRDKDRHSNSPLFSGPPSPWLLLILLSAPNTPGIMCIHKKGGGGSGESPRRSQQNYCSLRGFSDSNLLNADYFFSPLPCPLPPSPAPNISWSLTLYL